MVEWPRLATVLGIVSTVVGAGVAVGAFLARISHLEQRVKELEEDVKDLDKKIDESTVRIERKIESTASEIFSKVETVNQNFITFLEGNQK